MFREDIALLKYRPPLHRGVLAMADIPLTLSPGSLEQVGTAFGRRKMEPSSQKPDGVKSKPMRELQVLSVGAGLVELPFSSCLGSMLHLQVGGNLQQRSPLSQKVSAQYSRSTRDDLVPLGCGGGTWHRRSPKRRSVASEDQ